MFKFRLQTVLELRQGALRAAERNYLLAKAKREDAEADHAAALRLRDESRRQPVIDIAGRLAAEAYIQRLDDEARALESAVAVLLDEESDAREKWIVARQEAEAIEKLREKAVAEHNLELNRKEQAELDEWAVLRRAA